MDPRRVVMVAMPCREIVEIGGALDVLYAANQALLRAAAPDPGYAAEVVSPVRTVRAWTGLRLLADRSYRDVRGALDTLVVTGVDGPEDARRDPDLVAWLAETAPRARRVVGLCTGSYLLAEAGLLDGRTATTHWMDCDELARRYPRVRVQRDPIYVRAGAVYTSAGATAGLDLLLALVEEDLGRRVALQVAQRMVFYLKRPGGQAQFSALLATQLAEREPLREVQAWILDHPGADLSVDALARRVAMSPRNFFRVFVREIGVTPARFVERVRVEAARRLLEETSRGVDDVAAACGFAHGLEVAVRGGGHNVSGKAVCDGGLMLDLSPMKSVRVDRRGRTARAEPGLTLAELDRECQAFGLGTPTGIVSATGIAGLTLGGGIGWLGGKHGLACDNVRAVDIVTADGRLRVASEDEHADLFWAVRGGGANVGVVTSFEYALHEVGLVLGGAVVWPLEQTGRVLRFYDEFARGCPDELSVNAGLATGPDGAPVLGVAVAWVGGPLDAGERLLKPLRSFASPLADMIAPMRLVDLQRGGDDAFPPGRRHYWKAGFLRRLEPAAIDVLVHFAATRPSPHTQIGLQQMHGAAARVPATATAFAHRHEQWDFLVLSQWDRPDDDEPSIRWTRELHAAMAPHLDAAVYVNDLGEDEPDRVRAAYGASFERLAAIKAAYDPDNFFRWNQNVAPATTSDAGAPTR